MSDRTRVGPPVDEQRVREIVAEELAKRTPRRSWVDAEKDKEATRVARESRLIPGLLEEASAPSRRCPQSTARASRSAMRRCASVLCAAGIVLAIRAGLRPIPQTRASFAEAYRFVLASARGG